MSAPLSQSEIIRRLEKRRPGSTSGSYPAPTVANIASWLRQFEKDLRECDIPCSQQQEAAFMILPGTIRTEMMKRLREGPCDWVGFKDAIAEAAIHLRFPEGEISALVRSLEEIHPGCTFGRYPMPTSTSMAAWFNHFETDFGEYVLSHLRHYAICLVLPAFMQKALFDKHGWERLSWIAFKLVLTQIVGRREILQSSLESSSDSIDLRKAAAVVGGVGLAAAGGAVLGTAVVVGGLNVVGFSAGGVVGGSIAASVQSAFYGGAVGGLFSVCQSIAATTVVPAAGALISAAGSTAAGSLLLRAATESDNDGNAPAIRRPGSSEDDVFSDRSDSEEEGILLNNESQR